MGGIGYTEGKDVARVSRQEIEYKRQIAKLSEKTKEVLNKTIDKLSLLYSLPKTPFRHVANNDDMVIIRCNPTDKMDDIYLVIDDSTSKVSVLHNRHSDG